MGRIVVVVAWVSTLALATTYLLIGRGVDHVIAGTPPTVAFAGALVAAAVSGVLSYLVLHICTNRLTRHEPRLRHQLLQHVFALGVAQRTRERAGRLVNSMTDGIERNAAHTSSFAAPMVASLLTPLLVVIVVGVAVDAWSALILAAAIPLVPACIAAFNRAFKTVSNRYRASSRALAAQELDAIQGLSALVRMNAGKRMGASLAEATETVRRRVMRYLAGNQIVLFVVDSVFSLGMITAAAVLAITRYDQGALTAGQGIALILLASLMLDPLDRIGQFFYIGMGGMAAGREIKRILAETPAVVDAPEARDPTPTELTAPGTVALDGVEFAWAEGTPVLAGASLHIDQGQHLVLTGESGAGKSTISALLQGQRRPDTGRILIDGVDVATAPLAWVRSRLSVVEQSTYLFTGTLRDNLLLARPDATESELLAAVTAARLGELVERLPQGLDTPVGQRGLALSGGEAQRVAIARALLKDAPILLLDEPTAHVDLHSEQEILATISDVARTRTTLTISHRSATIASADRRVELVEGVIR